LLLRLLLHLGLLAEHLPSPAWLLVLLALRVASHRSAHATHASAHAAHLLRHLVLVATLATTTTHQPCQRVGSLSWRGCCCRGWRG